ncbi:MAG TPA: radical SAM protein, partial [Vicinamibacterales bacterium]|nr:radical SAM protein [Vicinamibacterales bacterium]
MQALLISTYEMGRQPFGLASPAAWLRAAGWDVACADLAKERLDQARVRSADLIAFHLPMHTATRLALPVIELVRRLNPAARLCAYGLYAPLNGDALRALGVQDVLGGEFEEDLVAIAKALPANAGSPPVRTAGPDDPPYAPPRQPLGRRPGPFRLRARLRRTAIASAKAVGPGASLPKLHFLVPDRSGLPPLSAYATLQTSDGHRRLVGYTETSRGCRHLCRHCPVVPIYNGQFRVVQPEVVLADIDAQIATGAEHITFGDPDFFNGPTHAMRIVEALHAAHPAVSYDVTIKVEHLLKHRALLPRLRDSGCAFVTSAVESVDDAVLALLEKGHTRQD